MGEGISAPCATARSTQAAISLRQRARPATSRACTGWFCGEQLPAPSTIRQPVRGAGCLQAVQAHTW